MLSRAGVPRHSIIKKFAGEAISKVEDLIRVLAKLSRGARLPLEYVSYIDRHRNKVNTLYHSSVCEVISCNFKLCFYEG